MRRSVAMRCLLGLVSAAVLSCAHGVAFVVGPDPCEAPDDEQLAELEAMVDANAYPGVERMVSQYHKHCCEDDALMNRENPGCGPDRELDGPSFLERLR